MEIAIEVITISRQMFIIMIRVDLDQPRLEMLLVDSIHVRNTLEEVMLDVKHPAQLPVFNRLVEQNFNRFRGRHWRVKCKRVHQPVLVLHPPAQMHELELEQPVVLHDLVQILN